MTGFWGTPIANEKCRTADRDPRRRHAARRGELELVGSALHVRDPADAADPHRRRRRRDRPQLPDRARRRRRREAGARRARAGGARRRRTAIAARCATRSRSGRRAFAANWDRPVELESVPDAARAHPERAAQGGARRRLHRHRRRLEQERRRRSSSRSPCPARSSRRAAWRRWDSGRRRCSASSWRSRIARPSRSSATAASARNPSVVATAMEAGLPRRLAGHGQRRRSARSPASTNDALRLEFGCLFECRRRAVPRRLRADGQGLRRATACSSSRPTSSARRLTRGAGVGAADRDPGADGERADADARALGHQRHLPEGQLDAGTVSRRPSRTSPRRTHVRWVPILALVAVGTMINYLDRTVLGIAAPFLTKDLGLNAATDGTGVLRLLVELRAAPDSRRHLPRSVRHARHLLHRRRLLVALHRR